MEGGAYALVASRCELPAAYDKWTGAVKTPKHLPSSHADWQVQDAAKVKKQISRPTLFEQ